MATKRFFGIGFSFLVAASLAVANADAQWGQQGERQVSFKAVGPGGLGIEGKGSDISLSEQGPSLVASVGLSDLATGIALRDKHMKEKYLEVAKYPRAVFTVDKAKVKSPGEGDIDGQLQLHGVKKSVRVHYKAAGNDRDATVTGSARINIKEFNIDIPSYLGVTVKPDVTVAFKLHVVDK